MSDYVLQVYTDKVGLLDTQKLDSCYQYGYNAVIERLEEIKKILIKWYCTNDRDMVLYFRL